MKMKIFHRGLILVATPLTLGLLLTAALYLLMQQSEADRIEDAKFRKITSLTARQMVVGTEAFCLALLSLRPGGRAKVIQLYEEDRLKRYKCTKEIESFMAANPDMARKLKIADGALSRFGGEFDSILDNMVNKQSSESQGGFSRESRGSGGMGSGGMGWAGRGSEGRGWGGRGWESRRKRGGSHMDRGYRKGNRLQNELPTDVISVQREGSSLSRKAQMKIEQSNGWQAILLGLTLLLNAIMCVALAIFFRRGILNRIRIIDQNTVALASGLPLLPELQGHDEIALLDQSFHSMHRQLQAASENERNLFNNASDVICVLNQENKFIKTNPACKRNWEYGEDELSGRDLTGLLLAEYLSPAEAAIESAKKSAVPLTFESCLKTKGGNRRNVLWSVYWSAPESSLYCIVHDTTEDKKLESMRKQFLSMISLDLKQPLNRISDAVSSILSEISLLSKLAIEKFEATRKNLKRLTGLVDELLGIAELEFGHLELHCQNTDLNVLLKQSLQDLELLAKEKELILELKTSMPCPAFCDPDRIMQVLVNLLSNAIKFSPSGKTITLSAEQNLGKIVCKIQDQGRGVTAANQARIFEKFAQSELADGKRKAGTGLGLPICKQIIEAHAGEIGVESREGEGSTFWFSLPEEMKNITCLATNPVSGSEAIKYFPKEDRQSATRAQLQVNAGPRRMPLSASGVILVGVPFLFGLLFTGSLAWTLVELARERSQEMHQREISFKAFELMSSVTVMANRVLFNPLLKDKTVPAQQYALDYLNSVEKLGILLQGDPESSRILEMMKKSMLVLKNSSYVLAPDSAESSPVMMMQKLRDGLQSVSAMVIQTRCLQQILDRAEAIEFQSPEKELALRREQSQILLAGLLSNIAISLGLALQFSLGISRRLLIMADNTGRVAREEELNPLIGGNNELSDLDASFHRLAVALLEARRKERAVFDNCKDVLCTVSAAGRFVGTNPAAELLWGYNKMELEEMPVLDLVFKDDQESARMTLFADFDRDEEIAYECRMVKKDGKLIHCLWSASVRKEQGALFCIVHDVTDKKELELLRNEFLAIVSHDLRTPLNSISAAAQLGQMGALGEFSSASGSALDLIISNCRSLIDLINDILDLEKLDAGKMGLNLEAIDIDSLLCELSNNVPGLTSENIDCAAELREIPFQADADRILQAIQNLARFMQLHSADSAAPHIRVSRAQNNIEIQLIDAGPLLEENVRKHLFDRYKDFSLDSGSGTAGFHADLRMPLAAKVIELHGGSLRFEELEGKYNLCTVLLPSKRCSQS